MLLVTSKFYFDEKLMIVAQTDFWGFWTIGFCDPSLNVVGIEKWQTNFLDLWVVLQMWIEFSCMILLDWKLWCFHNLLFLLN
jgi:hypothetical protein